MRGTRSAVPEVPVGPVPAAASCHGWAKEACGNAGCPLELPRVPNDSQRAAELLVGTASGGFAVRPGTQTFLADARAGAFDGVVPEALIRMWCRDQADVSLMFKQLKFAVLTPSVSALPCG